jgi:acyl-CoA thioester hydrolase
MTDISAQIELKVPFYDVDPMAIVWHGNYLKYFEKARCHLLDQLNYNYLQMQESGYLWPVIDARVKYVKSLTFQQLIIVKVTLAESDYGMKFNFLITDKTTGERLSTGYTKHVAVSVETKEMCLLSPKILAEKIDNYAN